MLSILTNVIGLVAKGKASKAIAGGLSGTFIMAAEPALKSFQEGFSVGVGSSVEELGVVAGQMIAGFITGYVITWLSPKNKDA